MVSFRKVTLTKETPSVSLVKDDARTGIMHVNLNWNTSSPNGGFLKRMLQKSRRIDLDLGCLYQFTDGTKGVVQALGGRFEARTYDGHRVIWLDGDDRSGDNSGGENLHVDLTASKVIKRMLVFAYIYEGVPNWAAADGVVTVTLPSQEQFAVHLDKAEPGSGMCAIAMIRNGRDGLHADREVRYFAGHDPMSRAYRWGMRWTPGQK